MNFMFYFIVSIKIFATVLKGENNKHHILQPEMIPCGLPKPKIDNTQKQSGHSNWKGIMKAIHLAFSKPQREGCGANIICPTFQMENAEIIKHT